MNLSTRRKESSYLQKHFVSKILVIDDRVKLWVHELYLAGF